ncbi:putative transporter [Colletotrichum viniferum]|nr:putative transporter [Colletotrichum viniferum]
MSESNMKTDADIVSITTPSGTHVDPEAAHNYVIDPAAEAKLLRRVDLRVLPMIFVLYFFTFLDRTNLGNAKVAGMEADLGLGTYGFNIGACLYYGIYFFADIPASLSVKRFGNIVLPLSCIAFGVVTLATAFIHNEASFFAIRLLLGITEAFQFPGLSYVVSRYYRRNEVTTRVSFFMLVAAGLASAFGGLLASGLLSLGRIGSSYSWRNIFLVEGIITIGVGFLSLYLFPADPSKTRIFNEDERALAMARIFHDQPAIREHKERISWKLIKRGILNVNVLVCTWMYTCNQVTVQGLSIFTVTILRLNYPDRSTVGIQLLSVPPPLVGMVFALCLAYITMKTRKHGYAIVGCATLNVIGYSIWLASKNVQARYAAIFINTAGGYGFGVLVISWSLANAAPDTVRNVANAAVSGLSNIGSIAATWSYINTDAKTGYRTGNSLNTATAASVVVASLSLVAYQTWENKRRERGDRDYRLRLPEDEVAILGHLHPNFRYIH